MYCTYQNQCSSVAAFLDANGVPAAAYHAGKPWQVRGTCARKAQIRKPSLLQGTASVGLSQTLMLEALKNLNPAGARGPAGAGAHPRECPRPC